MGSFNSTVRWVPPSPFSHGDHLDSDGNLPDSPGTSSGKIVDFVPGGQSLTSSGSTHSNVMGSNAPVLYEQALVGQWEAIVKRALLFPQEAAYSDKCKNTALHLACRRQPPVDVVMALIRAYPEGALKKTLDGLTPLHFACYCGASPNVVGVLLEWTVPHHLHRLHRRASLKQNGARENAAVNGGANGHSNHSSSAGGAAAAPQDPGGTTTRKLHRQKSATMPPPELLDRRGRTPLHCACAGFRTPHRPAVVRLLLSSDPNSSTTMDERSRTPLSLIMDDYAEEIEDAIDDMVTPEEAKDLCLKGELKECWDITGLLLRAAYRGTVTDDDAVSANEVNVAGEFRIVHAAAGVLECPPPFMRLVLKVYPEKVREKDGDFNLPLHVAARAVPRVNATLSARARFMLSSGSRSFSNMLNKGNSGGCGASGVYNADFGRSPSFSTRASMPASLHKKKKPQFAYSVIQDLVELYGDAAAVPDEGGAFPLTLAIESGKPWHNGIKPILDAYPPAFDDEDEDCSHQMRSSLLSALSSPMEEVRDETVKTLSELAKVWKNGDDLVRELVQTSRHYSSRASDGTSSRVSSGNATLATTGQDSSVSGGMDDLVDVQATMLRALAVVLANIDKKEITLPGAAESGLGVGVEMLSSDDEGVRDGAARVIGSAVELMGTDCAVNVMRGVMLPRGGPASDDDGDMSNVTDDTTSALSTPSACESAEDVNGGNGTSGKYIEDDTDEAKHGRAMGIYHILSSPTVGSTLPSDVFNSTTSLIKELMKEHSPVVRKAACMAVGAVIGRSGADPASTLREVKSSVLKCMKATEDTSVHRSLARGLSIAVRMNPSVFLCKAGMPILDGALMLSVSGTSPSVQAVFHDFLWLALGVGDGQAGLDRYMELAEGENGRIMMTLATKTLAKIEEVVVVEEEDADGC